MKWDRVCDDVSQIHCEIIHVSIINVIAFCAAIKSRTCEERKGKLHVSAMYKIIIQRRDRIPRVSWRDSPEWNDSYKFEKIIRVLKAGYRIVEAAQILKDPSMRVTQSSYRTSFIFNTSPHISPLCACDE